MESVETAQCKNPKSSWGLISSKREDAGVDEIQFYKGISHIQTSDIARLFAHPFSLVNS